MQTVGSTHELRRPSLRYRLSHNPSPRPQWTTVAVAMSMPFVVALALYWKLQLAPVAALFALPLVAIKVAWWEGELRRGPIAAITYRDTDRPSPFRVGALAVAVLVAMVLAIALANGLAAH